MAPWRAAGCAALVVACARGEEGAADVLVPSTLSILFAAPFLDYSKNMHEVQSGFLWALEEVNNSTEVLPSTEQREPEHHLVYTIPRTAWNHSGSTR